MRRHLSFVLALVAVGACTFPDPQYLSGDDGSAPNDGSSGGTDRSTSSSSGGNDGSSGRDASGDRTTSADAPVDVIGDMSASDSSGGDGAVDCDVDKDTFQGSQCGGNDCCDSDPNAHPNQMMFFTSKDACGSWDYNCDMTIEYEFPQNIPCTGTPTLGCNGGPGFLGTEDCGQSGPYGSCQPNGAIQCSLKQTGSDTQGCQ